MYTLHTYVRVHAYLHVQSELLVKHSLQPGVKKKKIIELNIGATNFRCPILLTVIVVSCSANVKGKTTSQPQKASGKGRL